jgi:hypothetical protein
MGRDASPLASLDDRQAARTASVALEWARARG